MTDEKTSLVHIFENREDREDHSPPIEDLEEEFPGELPVRKWIIVTGLFARTAHGQTYEASVAEFWYEENYKGGPPFRWFDCEAKSGDNYELQGFLVFRVEASADRMTDALRDSDKPVFFDEGWMDPKGYKKYPDDLHSIEDQGIVEFENVW